MQALGMSGSAFERNAQFLNKEISFFLDGLRRKATENGLNEDSLLPLHDQRDQQICKCFSNVYFNRPIHSKHH